MVGVLRALGVETALPAAVAAAAALSSSSSSSSSSSVSTSSSWFPSSCSSSSKKLTHIFRSATSTNSFFVASRTAASHMSSPVAEPKSTNQHDGVLPELLTEFMVEMKCEGCVSAVKDNLLKLDGIKNVDVDLSNQVVRVLGSLPVKTMVDALEQTGRNARLIGQGSPNDFLVSAAVAEFKGPVVYGVVRFAQVNMELARIEANFSGLSPGKHVWSINEFGDLTEGAASTGKIFNLPNFSGKQLGDLGTLEVVDSGEANFSGSKEKIRVSDLIGRSVVVYETEDKSDVGMAAAVIARSAGVGENYKKICTCDGVTIWESN